MILPGPPDVQITMAGGITYEEFNFMLGILNLDIRQFFLEAQIENQLDTNLAYNILDSSGVQTSNTMKPRKSPYQYQNSLAFKPAADQPAVLNGLSSISFNLYPLQTMTMTLLVNEVGPAQVAPGRLKNNIATVEDTLGNFKRFQRLLKKGP